MLLGIPKLCWPLKCLLCLPLLSVSVWAQGETTGAIVGSVTDPAGAAIAGARVTVTSTENGLVRSAITDNAGRFNFPQLKPGAYSVKVEANLFESQRNNSVVAGLGQRQTADFTLGIARSNQSVMVTERAPLINPQNPNTS